MKHPTISDLAPYASAMTGLRHDLHRYPEIGFDLPRTSEKVAKILRATGMEVHTGIGETGVIGVLKKGSGNGRLLLRADMDALPIQETANLAYRSQTDGKMHACGHDGHTATLLTAAQFLSKEAKFSGVVIFLFQPNEEHGLGAKAMLSDRLMERFAPDEMYALHTLPGAPLGEVSSRVGDICASETLFELTIRGRGGHSSMPHVGAEALVVGASLVQTLQTIVSRKLAPGSGAVLSVTEFETDGTRNVLPGRAVLRGDFRARDAETRDRVDSAIRKICKGVAVAHDVEIDVDLRTEFVETINSPDPVARVVAAAGDLGLPCVPNRAPMPFSEDFGQFARRRPACFFLLGNGTEGRHAQPLHSSTFDFNDAALQIGAALWARLVTNRLPL